MQLYFFVPVDLSSYDELTIEFFVRQHEARAEGMVMELGSGSPVVAGEFYVDINGWGPGTLGSVGVPWHSEVAPAGAVGEGWRHFAAVYNVHASGAGRWIAYLDGTPVPPDSSLQNAVEGLRLLNDVLYIGSRGGSSFFLDADLDDVKITGKALLPGQFMRARSGALDDEATDVVAYWPFDQRDPLADASGNGHRLESEGVSFPKKGTGAASGDVPQEADHATGKRAVCEVNRADGRSRGHGGGAVARRRFVLDQNSSRRLGFLV